MRIPALLLSSLLLIASAPAFGGDTRELSLVDGSVLRAEIVSLLDGVYSVHSESLGTLTIPARDVLTIRSPNETEAPSQPDQAGGFVGPPAFDPPGLTQASSDELQRAIMSDPDAMSKVLSLQDDPAVQSILQDEATMRAITGGDLGTLLGDPKIRALMENPTIRELGQGYADE